MLTFIYFELTGFVMIEWFDVQLIGRTSSEEFRVLGTQESVTEWAAREVKQYGGVGYDIDTESTLPPGATFKTERTIAVVDCQ